MLILGVISLIQMRNIIYKDSSISLFASKLICNDLQILLDSNITLLCEDQFNYSIQYDSLFGFEIDVTKSINIINNSNFIYDQINLSSFKELFNTTADTEITFKEFLNMSVIKAFINIFQSSYENIKLTMEWSKYVKDDSSYCQWDQSSILPIYDGIIDQFKQISESLLWSKLCINNQAFIVGVEDPGKIINISKMTIIIIVVSIIAFFILVILTLYCIAKCRVSRNSKIFESSMDESSSDQKKSNKYYSKRDFNRCFFKELLGIGTNAGSLIFEAISIFKTFQRMSATKTFSVHFPKDCYKMFSWANNLIEMIFSNIYLRSFEPIEMFYCITYIVPFIGITFLGFLFMNYKFYYIMMIDVVLTAWGFGFGYIKYNLTVALCCIFIIFFGFLFIGIYFDKMDKNNDQSFENKINHITKNGFDFNEDNCVFPFTFSIFNSLIIVSIFLIPFFLHNFYVIGSYLFICLIIVVVCFIIELLIGHFQKFTCMMKFFFYRFLIFVFNILQLLAIPTTEILVEVITGKYKNNWACIVGYVFIILISFFYILGSLIIIKSKYNIFENSGEEREEEEEEGEEKEEKEFDKDGFIFIFAMADFLKQLAFAFVSAYDIPWACFGIELYWVFFILLFGSWGDISASDTVSGVGSSIVVIISTVISLVCKYKKTGFLSFEVSVSLVIIACIPAILSLYTFFGCDFELGGDEEEEDDDEALKMSYTAIALLLILMTPWFSVFFGMFIPVIVDHFNDFYSNYHKM